MASTVAARQAAAVGAAEANGLDRRNITFDLIEAAREAPKASAISLPHREVSYADLDGLVRLTAQWLVDEGVRRGDVLALTFRNEFLLALVILGAVRIGATVMPVGPSATVFQRREWFDKAGCRLRVADVDPEDGAIPTLLARRQAMLAPRPVKRAVLDETPEADCLIAVGSGSTGRSKLIPFEHAQIGARALLAEGDPTYRRDCRMLSMLGLHVPSIVLRLFVLLRMRACMVIGKWQFGEEMPAQILERSVDTILATPFHTERLLNVIPSQRGPFFGSEFVYSAGAAVVSDVMRERIRDRITPTLRVAYGANECFFISLATGPEVFEVSGTVGRPLPGVEVAILSENGSPAPKGELGHIFVKSATVVRGYLGDSDSTAKAFRHGGFMTGDLGRFDGREQLIHCGRGDLIMTVNSLRVHPAEIEECLLSHEALTDASAIDVRDAMRREIPICAVVLKPDANTTADELHAFARERIGLRAPAVFILDEIPRNERGKVIRDDLRAMIAERMKR